MKRYGLLIFASMIVALCCCTSKQSDIVAHVDSEPITIQELRHFMLLKKSEVYSHFYRNHDVVDEEDFWHRMYDNQSPMDMLKKRSLYAAIRCKVQQLLALEKGLVNTISYEAIMANMEGANRERKAMVEREHTTYGPVVFTSRTYFDHLFDHMVIQLKYDLSENELKIPHEAIGDMQFDNHAFQNEAAGFYQLQYVDKLYEGYIDELIAKANIDIFWDVLERIGME